MKKLTGEFRDFLLKTNMLALALAVVLGTAVSKVVDAIVSAVIMPFVGTLKGGSWERVTLGVGDLQFRVGVLIDAVINFLIIATIVFLTTKLLVRQGPPPPSKTCRACREAIHVEATRCKFCTSPAEPAA